MNDEGKTKEQLINELAVLRQHIAELEELEIRHKQVEEQLRQSEEKLRLIFDSLAEGVTVSDLDGKIVQMNKAVVRMHGYNSKEEIIGRSAFELIAGKDHDRAMDNIKKTLEKGYVKNIEYTFLTKDGGEFPAELSAYVLRDLSGNSIGFVAVTQDITERRQTEENQRKLEQELNISSRLACIGELASGVAHEINNPLTAVIGFSQMLMGREIPEDAREYLKIIDENAQRVAKIVKNLLIFARQRKPGKECIDMNSLISRVVELRAYEMKTHNIEVTTDLAPDLPSTMADGGQLQQVFLNIILNAEQAMVTAHNKGNLLIKTELIGNRIRISFEDDGPGIASENLDKIFDPFFTTKPLGEGTGLGLSLSYGIVKAHKGKIYARSKLGHGATFVVELPIVSSEQLEVADPAVEEPTRVTPTRIMVVDDEPAICQLLSSVLTEDGHNVETMDNAATALERLKHQRYGLVLLDIRMTGMDGIELYRHIGEIASSLQRRVVFITGDTMTSGTQHFLDRTKARCISKPFDTEGLRREIKQILLERST